MKKFSGNAMACAALIMGMCGCDNFEYHPYDAPIHGNISLNATAIEKIQASISGLPMKFAFVTDTQSAYDELAEAVEIIKSRGDVDFIVHGGDQTDFGLPDEFVWCRDILEKSGLPFFAVIGNHDCLGNGEDTFRYIYGEKNFSFNVAGVHFLCLNTNALEYDYSEPVPDLDFMEADAAAVAGLNAQAPGSVSHTVVVMHSRPYDEQFNNNVAKPFLYYLTFFPGMEADAGNAVDEAACPGYMAGTRARGFCINGHNHSQSVLDINDGGILFYQSANMRKRSFLIFTVTDEGYEMEVVDF